MKKFYLITFIGFSILFSNQAYSQQADSLKQEYVKHMRRDLVVSEDVAQQVVSILVQYKENAKTFINDKGLTGESLRVKLDQLIDDKNKKLKKLLTEQQLQKIVPTSERPEKKASSGS